MKKRIGLLLAGMMIVSLAGCGKKETKSPTTETKKTEAAAETNAPVKEEAVEETEAPVKEETAAETDASAKEKTAAGAVLEGIDLESGEVQAITEERASMEALAEAKNEWLEGLNIFAGTEHEKLTYEDFVKHIGCDASEFLGGDSMKRVFVWHPAENEKAGFQITFYNYGNGWVFNSLGTSNIN